MEAQAKSKALDVVSGDMVIISTDKGSPVVTEILPRKNKLSRVIGDVEKVMVANLDLLIIVTAVGDVFNPVSIDRALAIARGQGIPRTLILNKVDLGESEPLHELLEWYSHHEVDVLRISAKLKIGLDLVREDIFRPGVSAVAVTGVSGVGKSTLLNVICPGAEIRTGAVSDRTGQGRQTTTQVSGYVVREGASPVILYDLPGVQRLGVDHLEREDVVGEFAEFRKFRCGFSSCAHIGEEDCGVKNAVDEGLVPVTRYNSYVGMIDELEKRSRERPGVALRTISAARSRPARQRRVTEED